MLLALQNSIKDVVALTEFDCRKLRFELREVARNFPGEGCSGA
jgi:hypothetical protein